MTEEDQRIFLGIQVIIDPDRAVLQKEVTLNFSVVGGTATGKGGSAVCVTSFCR